MTEKPEEISMKPEAEDSVSDLLFMGFGVMVLFIQFECMDIDPHSEARACRDDLNTTVNKYFPYWPWPQQ